MTCIVLRRLMVEDMSECLLIRARIVDILFLPDTPPV